MTAHVTEVAGCTVQACAFNHDHDCNAFAITVSGSQSHASCGTFIDTGALGGLPKVLAHVGACQRSECVHNEDLMCGAQNVRIGPGAEAADCLSYQAS
ncbi:DUF1540 domain-containing protein [Galactobacter caseinivorans]|uniref:DUF1540 domain-containing protein n=1 Tax=Galactobacter caseinivorans TaxID=2676123 RepID=A0A496PKU0_9MICC|nr:DUF1540 domain-containing protein [Galactobacter caseinivorans]RKW71132.1 DUF1540 domain-containing protein [Galactobacter caseinivorans]